MLGRNSMEMMVAEKAESFDAPPFSRKDHDDIESRGEIAGTSPRSVLGPWEMIGVGRLHSSHNNCQAATDALYPSCSQNNCPGIIPNIDLNIEALQDFVGQAEWKTLRKDDFMHLFRNDWQVYTSEQGKLHSSSGPRLMTEGIREVPKILNKKLCRDKRGSASSFKISPNLMHLTPPLVKPLDSGTGLLNIEECSHMALGLSGKPDKQKRKRQRWVSDPLLVLGPDILFLTFSYLDAHSLAQCLLVSQDWQALAAADCLWGKKCEELWVGKAHLPRTVLHRGISKLSAYSLSVLDGKRTRIMKEDLCNHAWEFRFKFTAPQYWLNLDPSWQGTGPPMRRYFHPDGSHTADPADRVWGGHECTYSIVTSYTDEGKVREHYVRINRWPRMSVSRKHNWGWELNNNVYCYSSIPDADREGGTGPLFPFW